MCRVRVLANQWFQLQGNALLLSVRTGGRTVSLHQLIPPKYGQQRTKTSLNTAKYLLRCPCHLTSAVMCLEYGQQDREAFSLDISLLTRAINNASLSEHLHLISLLQRKLSSCRIKPVAQPNLIWSCVGLVQNVASCYCLPSGASLCPTCFLVGVSMNSLAPCFRQQYRTSLMFL